MMRKKSPSPDLTPQRSDSPSPTMAAIPEGGEMESVKVKEEELVANGEVKKEKGLKRHISK